MGRFVEATDGFFATLSFTTLASIALAMLTAQNGLPQTIFGSIWYPARIAHLPAWLYSCFPFLPAYFGIGLISSFLVPAHKGRWLLLICSPAFIFLIMPFLRYRQLRGLSPCGDRISPIPAALVIPELLSAILFAVLWLTAVFLLSALGAWAGGRIGKRART